MKSIFFKRIDDVFDWRSECLHCVDRNRRLSGVPRCSSIPFNKRISPQVLFRTDWILMDGCAGPTLLFAIQGGIDTFALACPILHKFDLRSAASISVPPSWTFYHRPLSLADRNASSPPQGEVTDGLRSVHSWPFDWISGCSSREMPIFQLRSVLMLEFKAVFVRYNLPRSDPLAAISGRWVNVASDFIASNSSVFLAANGEAIEFSMFTRMIESIPSPKLPFTLLYYVVAWTNRSHPDPTLRLIGTFHVQRGRFYIASFDSCLRFPQNSL